MKYNPNEIEAKWQKYWAENKIFKAENNSDKPKYYVLDMFPYPSGAGLHVGHPLGYIASDILARYKRHKGYNVLHPQGYDSFGLPAEQYAIQTGQHPEKTTQENIDRYRQQLDKIGFSFDWNREIKTSSPDYYKWTQWIFIQFFESWYNKKNDRAEAISELVKIFEKEGNENVQAVCDEAIPLFSATDWNSFSSEEKQQILLKYRLAYLAETEVNWCPALGTVLANDEIVNGVSERGGHPIERKKMTQWNMRITAYADRLLQGLETIDWSDSIKESQRNWIGKSQGASIRFPILSDEKSEFIEVFTTRPDTIFGVTYLTLAPEHPLVVDITTQEKKQAVLHYIQATTKRSERERMADTKNISGVFTGAYALHPITQKPIPIWIGDYVLANYGTGAVMAVPAGDERDFAFAKHFVEHQGMSPIINIFDKDISENAFTSKENITYQNSDFLNGKRTFQEAFDIIVDYLEKENIGQRKTNYRLRDAVFSRQRYWGEPFPVYYVNGLPQVIEQKHLPILLPKVEKYLPTEQGLPPLANAHQWAWDTKKGKIVETQQIDNKTVFPMELNTMPGWAGSSWYWLRYMDAKNDTEFVSLEALHYWKDVDLYVGGSEHATGHLLYSRFWNKFLKDRGFLQEEEPFKKLINQGMILGTSAFVYRLEGTNTFISKNQIFDKKVQPIHVDISLLKGTTDELDTEKFRKWRPEFENADFIFEKETEQYICGREVEKMSKSKYNVVNPDDICNQYGADTLRLYEMFLGPIEQAKPWNTSGITGVANFLKKFYNLYFQQGDFDLTDEQPNKKELKILHTLIKKIETDIENFSFNTSVSQFMITVNELQKQKCTKRAILEPLALLISPFAPHIAEELWQKMGHSGSISRVAFPLFDEKYIVENTKEYPVSFNGKVRFKINLSIDLSTEEIQELVLQDERIQKQLEGKEFKKVIIVPGKIINIVQ